MRIRCNAVLSLLFICMMAPGFMYAANVYTLQQALDQKLIRLDMSGAPEDTTYSGEQNGHLGPCISAMFENTTSASVQVLVEYGYRLVPDDTTVQTMLVTQNLLVTLPAKSKKSQRLYAMCSQAGKSSPSTRIKFKTGKRATGHLLGIAELINRKKYQNGAAQNAVWCITDDHSLTSIVHTDTTIMYDLRTFVAKAKGLPLASIYNVYSPGTVTERTVVRTAITYSGSLTYNVLRPAKVMIALFDESNSMKKVYVNEQQTEGKYTYDYRISSDEFDNRKKHILRMFKDGKIEYEIPILPRD